MVLRAIILFSSKRVPLIKFRKGGLNPTAASNQASQATTTAQAPKPAAVSSNAIEDYELPRRFWRKPIDVVEMEYINRGGPA